MFDVMGVINLVNESKSLDELTLYRNFASIPFGSRYRLIDFTLSNMVNSGIMDVAVMPFSKFRSLIEHLESGKNWGLDRKKGGLFFLPPANNYYSDNTTHDIYNFYQHLDFFESGSQKYVLISNGNNISNMDYRPAFHYHIKKRADITIYYKEMKDGGNNPNNHLRIVTDNTSKVIKMGRILNSNKIFLGILIMDKSLLIGIIYNAINTNKSNLIKDSIIPNLNKLKVFGFAYNEYFSIIDSIESYYYESMNLLHNDLWKYLFYQPRYIYTKSKNDPPIKYLDNSRVNNSLIANGCIIDGTVENSILFRGVKVGKNAIINDSVIMQKSEIGENAMIVKAILDKKVKVRSDKKILGKIDNPYVVKKLTNY